ncbi:pickpocket protein 28-like [Contarinia nasturtii]|uniref:pickpocket protein 28-like n=1 Tax=Contarinia nasturtii TaxID=265458 RepID=UPI0012D3E535|nr:pickpocket protein 28-like [Contarinia nasturtii]
MAPGMMIVKNNPNVLHWSLENGYEEGKIQNEYPRRTSNTGLGTGLYVFSNIHVDHLEYICRDTGLGVKVFLTMPYLNDFQVTIKPKLTTTSNALRKYKPSQRQCFFSSERRLRFFKLYTGGNCEVECLANFTRIMCNCVRFSMPRDNATNICGPASIKCYVSAADKLYQNDNHAKSFREHCNCMPACTSIEYNTDVSSVPYQLDILQTSYNQTCVNVSIFYGNHQVETLKRTEAYSFNDFLAICGGLLGLFLGISLLSIMELVYYFTIRLFFIFCGFL